MKRAFTIIRTGLIGISMVCCTLLLGCAPQAMQGVDAAPSVSALQEVPTPSATPISGEELLARAQQLFSIGNYKDAILIYQQANSLGPQNSAVHLGLAKAYLVAGLPDKAIEAYQQARCIEPQNIIFIQELITLYTELGDQQGVGRESTDLIALQPDKIELYTQLAEVYKALDERPLALETLHQAIVECDGMFASIEALVEQ